MALVEAYDSMTTVQAGELPEATSNEGEGRWADMKMEGMAGHELQASNQQLRSKQDWAPEECGDEFGSAFKTVGGLESAGSQFHEQGLCKPCAFFHTKGCASGADCQFCHLCPALEKQRRKRMRRQLCHNMHQPFDPRSGGAQVESRPSRTMKGGHSRMISLDSASTCSGWGNPDRRFEHSRQTSTSSQATSVPKSGSSGDMGNLGYSPTYANAPAQGASWNSMQQPVDIEESFPGAADVLSSMPSVPSSKLTGLVHKEPPPPQVAPTLPNMSQAPTMYRSQHMVPAPLDMTGACHGHYEQPPQQQMQQQLQQQSPQAMQCSNGSPVGYMTYGDCQYALVAVPIQPDANAMSVPVSPSYADNSQVATFSDGNQQQHQQQQPWDHYQESPQHGGAYMVSAPYSFGDVSGWAGQYEMPAPAPVQFMGSPDGSAQWW